MSEINAEELDDFVAKLGNFMETLSEPQLDLLNRILKIAWNATEVEDSLDEGFNGSFSPDQADLILAYDPSGSATGLTDAPVAMIPRLIKGLIK